MHTGRGVIVLPQSVTSGSASAGEEGIAAGFRLRKTVGDAPAKATFFRPGPSLNGGGGRVGGRRHNIRYWHLAGISK
jgi:hypothetical protein